MARVRARIARVKVSPMAWVRARMVARLGPGQWVGHVLSSNHSGRHSN